MPGDVSVCQVCLRTDRNLDFVEVQLAIFYSELVAELVRFPIKYQNNKFCSDCAHLLRRFYNFRNKCRKAHKIMLDWKKLILHKPPLETLHDFLPNAMGVRTAKGNIIFDYSQDTETNMTMNDPTLTNNANNTLALGGNQNLLEFVVPIIAPMSQLINVPTINDNTEIKDPIKLEKDDNDFTNFEIQDVQIQDVKTQNVPNINKEIKSIEADTITFIERNSLQVKLEHDYEVEDVANTTNIKDTVCNEEDFKEFLHFDCLKAANINIKELDDIDNVMNDSDIEQENIKRPDVIIVDDKIEGLDLTDEDFSDFKDAVSDDNNDDDSTDDNDDISASDKKRIDNITTKLTQSLNDFLGICDIYQKLLPVKNIFELKHYKLTNTLSQKAINLFMTNFDVVIRNHEITMTILQGDKMLLKDFAKNILMKIINEEDTTSPGGSGIDKEFISQCLVEKEPMTNVKAMLKILSNRKMSDAAKKKLIIKRTKKLETSYKDRKWDDLSEIFDIEYLNTDQKAREEFERRKTYSNYVEATFKCEICYLPLKHSRLLDIHMLNHNMKAGEFSCDLCKTYYVSQRKLNSHRSRQHHKIFKCKLCSVVIRIEGSAADHRNYHKGLKIVCDLCNKQFNWRALYYAHRSKVHGCNFICSYCACAFPTEKKLEEHKVTHQKTMAKNPIGADNPGVKCDDCGLVFISKNVCEKHIQRTHMKVIGDKTSGLRDFPSQKSDLAKEETSQPVICEHCGMLFATKKGLGLHIVSHKKVLKKTNKEVQCRVCGIMCFRRYDLSLHFKEKHPDLDIEVVYADQKPFMCDNCGKGFQNRWLLQDHILTHSNVKPFECTECPKRYYTQRQLWKHAVYHLPKSKECDVCGKMFRTASNLFSHKRSHTQERKFECKHCGKGFLHRASVREHIRGVHHGIRRTKKTDTGNKNKNEPGKDGLDKDNVVIAEEFEIAGRGDEIIATRDKVSVTTRVLRKRRTNDESLKVFATTSKRVRQESSSESEDTE